MFDSENVYKIENLEEAKERLIDSNFTFSYDEYSHKLIIRSGPERVEDDKLITGFTYKGPWLQYGIDLEMNELTKLIEEAFNQYKGYIYSNLIHKLSDSLDYSAPHEYYDDEWIM